MRVKNTKELGNLVKSTRKAQGLTQLELAGSSGVGVRFLSELEQGKETCQVGKVLHVLQMLGLLVELSLPSEAKR